MSDLKLEVLVLLCLSWTYKLEIRKMNDFITTLEAELKNHSNVDVARGQAAYIKNNFEFYGIKTPERRKIQKPFLIK